MSMSQQDYSQIAPSYDEQRFQTDSGRFLYETDRLIVRELVALTKASTLLDVPVGTGRVLDYLKDTPIAITGCDVTVAMLERAKQRMVESRHTLLYGDASNLPFESGSFDCITSLRFFHLFAPQVRHTFVREFSRVLKPGGYVLCSFTNGWYGGGINWARKLLGQQTVHFLWPGELSRLFPSWRVCALRGNFFPFQWWLASKGTRLDLAMKWFNARTPMNRFCWERFYLLKRP